MVKLGSDLSKLNFPNKLSEYRAKIQSGFNPISEKKKKTSKYKGVSYRSDKKKWESYIYDSTTKKNLRLGYFASEEEAYETRIKKCKELGINVQ